MSRNQLNFEQTRERVAKLRQLIDDYRYHYHVLDESLMSEAAADSLKHELSQLEEQFPELITPDSPTQKVAGQALDKFNKVTHQVPMISLADVFSEEEIRAWQTRIAKLLPVERATSMEYWTDIKMGRAHGARLWAWPAWRPEGPARAGTECPRPPAGRAGSEARFFFFCGTRPQMQYARWIQS